MSNDPAFLFYPADASEDTQFMNRLERGAYFDLIKAQKIFGGYTVVQLRKVLGKDFDEVWPALELVLGCEDGKYFIKWLRDSFTKRDKFSLKQRERVQKRWKNDTNNIPIKNTNSGNTAVLPQEEMEMEMELEIEIGNENEIGNAEGGLGETTRKAEKSKKSEQSPPEVQFVPPKSMLPKVGIVAEMLDVVKKYFPKYPDSEDDPTALLQIAYKIAKMQGWPEQSVMNGKQKSTVSKWEETVIWIRSDDWFRQHDIRHWNKYWADLNQKKQAMDEESEKTPFFEELLDVWSEFYENEFNSKPSPDRENLKTIILKIRNFCYEKKYVWDKDFAKKSLTHFLKKAIKNDWLRENFLLSNIAKQFDSILNSQKNGNSKSQQPATGANVSAQSIIQRINASNY